MKLRLIPARAGNTWGTRRLGALSAAHPRSRGEHGQPSLHSSFQGGSSPLARGTLKMKKPSIAPTRLIPARAGNTVASVVCKSPWTAHPRSRGEHHHQSVLRYFAAGSSPLARGTHFQQGGDFTRRRLIPARAGNTVASSLLHRASSAHPRSRGEHVLWPM